MHEISIVTDNVNSSHIKPLRDRLGSHLCKCYGMVAPQQKKALETSDIELSIIPFFVAKIVSIMSKHGIVPDYYVWYYRMKTIDYVFSKKMYSDPSSVIYTNPFLCKTVETAKKNGKKVVLYVGNSEPDREYQRVMLEYKKYKIKNKYIYGDYRFERRCKKSYELSDVMVPLSQLSLKTYYDAGYDMKKIHLIPMTGTDFPLQSENEYVGKRKAFITTGFHNFVKGTHRLLLAWQRAKVTNVPLLVVGRLSNDIKEFIDKYGPFPNVKFLGYVSGSLIDFYKQYDAVGMQLSFSEGAVRTTPELMSFGFPMIVSQDATCDIVKDGYNGYVVDPSDDDSLVEKIRFFSEDWEHVHSMRKNVLHSVSHRTMNDYASELADYLIKLTNK